MTAVRFERVGIAFGSRSILSGVSLDIADGEFVGVLGPNGAGKTTLMRAILGLVRPTEGAIAVLGGPARRGNPGVGYLPQMHRSAPGAGFSGWDLVASSAGGGRWGWPGTSAAERRDIERALDLTDARDLARRPVGELSGGQRQRLLLAQALVGRPRLLLLDEPLISLDPSRQRSTVELVRRLRHEQPVTVLFSAHEINPLLGAIDRVLYLGNGAAALGTVDEVITSPVLSRLYAADIDVVRLGGRIFVMAGGHDIERAEHRHDA